MKILYISKADHVDYQDDCLTIGLKELYGSDIIDYNKRQHIYTNYSEEQSQKLYGRGYSVTRVIPDIEVDRTDITQKIKTKYFDYIIYGSIWRCSDYLEDILKYYPKNKVIAIDGEDETNIHNVYSTGILYFKRELIYTLPRLYPISFSVPTSKICNIKNIKIRDNAICDPRDKSTYIYKTEQDYYNGYKEAFFGITMKKAGWDCMRHYEILANNCLPLFLDINSCPILTMVSFPKQLCIDINTTLVKESPINVYNKYYNDVYKHFIENNTTEAEAKKFIITLKLC